MSGPEMPSPAERPLSRQEKERLLQKMYSLPHWIAVIRLFAYKTLSLEEARTKVKPLAEQFRKESVADACEQLVEMDANEKVPVARLKAHIRRMAFQILGPETPPAPAMTATPDPTPPSDMPMKRSAKREVPGIAERPIKQPRHLVLNRYQAWLDECGLAFVVVKDVSRTTPAVKPFITGLDFIVLREEAKLLVTVRPHLQAKHLKAIAELQKLFGQDYRPVRVWPTERPDGWCWQEYAVDVPAGEGP
jgi:hypothetical protein